MRINVLIHVVATFAVGLLLLVPSDAEAASFRFSVAELSAEDTEDGVMGGAADLYFVVELTDSQGKKSLKRIPASPTSEMEVSEGDKTLSNIDLGVTPIKVGQSASLRLIVMEYDGDDTGNLLASAAVNTRDSYAQAATNALLQQLLKNGDDHVGTITLTATLGQDNSLNVTPGMETQSQYAHHWIKGRVAANHFRLLGEGKYNLHTRVFLQ